MWVSSTSCAGDSHSVRIGWFSFCNIKWIIYPNYTIYFFTCDCQSVVIMPGTTISILPASQWNVNQTWGLGLEISSEIGNFIGYVPSGEITLNIFTFVILYLNIFQVVTNVKQEPIISTSMLPHRSAWPGLSCYLVNTHALRLWINSTSFAVYSQSVRVGWFSFCNIRWIIS